MGKAPIPQPDYSNAGAARDRRPAVVTETATTVGRALQQAADATAARTAIQAAPATHGHGPAAIVIDFDALGPGVLRDANCRTLQDVVDFLNENLRL